MLASLSSAVSGLSAHQTKMDVIGNNIANINTYGFKSSRVTFTDVFYQTLASATESSSSSGGTNPTQLGYGATVNSIDVINTQAGSTTTDRSLDVYINGDGYLAVQGDDGSIKYTRVGILDFDSSGNLVDSNGNAVLGLPTNSTTGKVALDSDGTVATSDLVAISVDPEVYSTYTDIAIGEDGAITATAEGDPEFTQTSGTGWIDGSTLATTTTYGDEDIDVTIVQASTATTTTVSGVTLDSTADAIGDMTVANSSGTYTLTYTKSDGTSDTATGTLTSSGTPTTYTLTFAVDSIDGTTDGSSITYSSTTDPSTSSSISLGAATAASKTITMSTYDSGGNAVTATDTWNAGETTVTLGDLTLTVDSDELAALEDITTSTQIGSIGAGDGESVTIGYLALVKFANTSGLSQDGEGYYVETSNSGEAVATSAGNEGTGTLVAGALESSNVDLSAELTEMIITQRGFQANTKMITVSDEMLDELVSMKR